MSAPISSPPSVSIIVEHFADGEAARLSMRDARRERGIETVEIERDVDVPGRRRPGAIGPGAHVDLLDAKSLRLIAAVPGHRAEPDLHQPSGQPFLHDPGERTGVREAVAFELVVEIRMRVDLQDRQRPSTSISARGESDR